MSRRNKTAGPLAPLGRRATSYDVAREAGVAQSTVSRSFMPGSEMSESTRARVQEVAAALGYVPNALARSLITRRSDMVAVIVTAFTLQANPAIVAGIGRALAGRGQQLLLMTVENEADARTTAQAALQYPLDGLVLATTLDAAAVRPFLRRGVPVVCFNRPAPLPRMDRVATDHDGASREVAAALHRAGHRRLLCVGGALGWPVNVERSAGFIAGLDSRGVGGVPVIPAEQSYAGGRAAFLEHVSRHGAPDAVFCVNDTLAFGVLDACRFDLGLEVPRDVSVVGFDDVAEAAHEAYRLTTVRQDIDSLAEAAVQMLSERLVAGSLPARRLLLPGLLVPRASACL
ncbi:MAG: LacI family DNA-binding transcriptional regulator [Acetobacteraceae bacterium]|nr:LacI family DNA-binding transcriptional regulator [Acetobacteraceae bacterium]